MEKYVEWLLGHMPNGSHSGALQDAMKFSDERKVILAAFQKAYDDGQKNCVHNQEAEDRARVDSGYF